MQKSDNISHQIKEELYDLEFDFDQEMVWKEISNDLRKKKRKKYFLFILLGILIIVSLWGLINTFKLNDKDIKKGYNKIEKIVVNSNKLNSESSNKKRIVRTKIETKESLKMKDQNIISSTKVESKQTNNYLNAENVNNNSKLFQYDYKQDLVQVYSLDQSENVTKPKLENQNLAIEINRLPVLSSKLFYSNNTELLSRKVLPFISKNIKKSAKISIGFINSIGFPFVHYSVEDNDYSQLQSNYRKSIQTLISVTNQLYLNYNITDNMSMSIGLEYQNIYQKFDWNYSYYLYEKQNSEKAYFESQKEKMIWYEDTIRVRSNYYKRRQTLQKNILWNIPISIDFEKNINRYTFGSKLGIILNVSHKFKGYYFKPENKIPVFENYSDNNIYKKQIGIGYSLSPYLSYYLNNNLQLSTQFEFRYYPNNWTSNSNPIETRINILSIGIGLKYNI